jgi:hypothetical protein
VKVPGTEAVGALRVKLESPKVLVRFDHDRAGVALGVIVTGREAELSPKAFTAFR